MKKLIMLCVVICLAACGKKTEDAPLAAVPVPEVLTVAEAPAPASDVAVSASDGQPRTKWFLISRAPDGNVFACWRITLETFDMTGQYAAWEQPYRGRMRKLAVTGNLSYVWVNDGNREMEQDAGNALGIDAKRCDYGKYPSAEK